MRPADAPPALRLIDEVEGCSPRAHEAVGSFGELAASLAAVLCASAAVGILFGIAARLYNLLRP